MSTGNSSSINSKKHLKIELNENILEDIKSLINLKKAGEEGVNSWALNEESIIRLAGYGFIYKAEDLAGLHKITPLGEYYLGSLCSTHFERIVGCFEVLCKAPYPMFAAPSEEGEDNE